jgi:hypothetical protein
MQADLTQRILKGPIWPKTGTIRQVANLQNTGQPRGLPAVCRQGSYFKSAAVDAIPKRFA